jgi:ABC-type nitrate/sulfonate/bicarbonate transport system permease component
MKAEKWGYSLFFVAVFLSGWELITRLRAIEPWLLPSPLRIVSALLEAFPLLMDHTRFTLLAALSGFACAIIIAVVLSIVMELSPPVKQGLYPLLIVSQTVPIIALAPLFIIWFGYQLLPKVVVVALVCFFPVVISLIDGMGNADPALINLLRVMGASPWKVLWKVRWPSALPHFFSGLKVAATYSIMGAVIGEWLGGSKGLGVFMTRAHKSFMVDRVFAAILIVSALSIALFLVVVVAARVAMPWKYRGTPENGGSGNTLFIDKLLRRT